MYYQAPYSSKCDFTDNDLLTCEDYKELKLLNETQKSIIVMRSTNIDTI